MDAGQVAAFLGVSLLVIVTPGQDTALTIRNTLATGRRGGVFTALGVVSGQLAWAIAASAGLAALLLASQPAFSALRLAGAAYLVFLGLQALVSAIRSAQPVEMTPSARRGGRTAFRQGVLSNLGNAKMAVFFTSLLPQFGTTFWTMFPLGLCFAALTLGWLTVYALAVARARRLLRRPRVSRLLDAVMGFVLVSLGLRLAAQR
jgi:threonine/homoserine/homoserine lactone efflux protein